MSFLNSSINPELSLTNSIQETELKTTFGSNMQTALNHDEGKETAARDSLNTNEGQDRHDSIRAVKECSTDDLFLNRKTTPSPKVLSWTTEEKETLPFVRSRHPRGDRVILLVLCLMCAAALGLSVLMLLGVLRPHGPPDTKIGKNESARCLCNFFSLLSEIYQKQPQKWNLANNCDKSSSLPQNNHSNVPTNDSKKTQPTKRCYQMLKVYPEKSYIGHNLRHFSPKERMWKLRKIVWFTATHLENKGGFCLYFTFSYLLL